MYSLRLVVSGLVQGVGFRPYVDSLVKALNLNGYVRNTGGSEVEIWVEGSEDRVLDFLYRLLLTVPEPAEVEHVFVERVDPRGFHGFNIEKSANILRFRSMVPPDFSICDDCLREVLSQTDRRYVYPLNSCVWCGPRFSMMYEVPYDRERTAMREFPLCPECLAEYSDPGNKRRYHAQGISCPVCGPKVYLYTNTWELVEVGNPVAEAAKLINEGYIVGVKGLGGYHIATLATDDEVVIRLRQRKRRPTKPFAVMALDLEVASKLVVIDEISGNLLKSPQRPIVLLPKQVDTPVSKYVSPGMAHEGVFLPYTALHYLLLMNLGDRFAVMTSGNVTDEPMCYTEDCARGKLSKIVDYILVHNRTIVNRVDDSVLRFTDGIPVLLRRARGYVPRWIRLPFRLNREIVALGADIHNAPAVAFEDKVVLAQYIGELDNGYTLSELFKYLEYFIRIYKINREEAIYVVDKHLRYVSRAVGLQLGREPGRVVEVQHHVAHVLSTMADKSLLGDSYIGIAIDGVGYGDDGAIWGCEIILVSRKGYERLGRLAYVKLSGSDRDVEYPARVLASYLTHIMDRESILRLFEKHSLLDALPGGKLELEVLLNSLEKYWVYSSSLGRFLDSVSVLLGVSKIREYEGSPAIRLEEESIGGSMLISDDIVDEVIHVGEVIEIDPVPLLSMILEFIEDSKRPKDIAYTVQYVIGRAIGRVVLLSAKGRRVSRIVPAGGGAIVNSIIVRGIRDELSTEDFALVLPSSTPPNDGGIALGQIYYLPYMNYPD